MKLLILLGIFFAGPALAAPRLTFEGVLTDTDGALLDGPVALTFALYDAAEGGAALWSETHPEVEVLEGDFYATLGDIEPLGTVLATDAPLWIGLAVEGEGELSPRNAITEVPRAAAALWAADVTGQHIHPREISVGDTQVIDSQGNWVGPAGPGGGATDYRYRFIDLDASWESACGLLLDGDVLCFGNFNGPPPPRGPFESITAGNRFACALNADGALSCWGSGPAALAPPGRFRQVEAGEDHVCGLLEDGSVTCWGENDFRQAVAPPGQFHSICSGWNTSCAITEGQGAIQCWGGSPAPNNVRPPPGEGYVGVTCSGQNVCGWRADNLAACSGPVAGPPPGLYRTIEAGPDHLCGLDPDNILTCWGTNGGAARRGPGLVSVTAGLSFSCGLRLDGTATCWGGSRDFAPVVPERLSPNGP